MLESTAKLKDVIERSLPRWPSSSCVANQSCVGREAEGIATPLLLSGFQPHTSNNRQHPSVSPDASNVPHAENAHVLTLLPLCSRIRMHSGFLKDVKFHIVMAPSALATAKICPKIYRTSAHNLICNSKFKTTIECIFERPAHNLVGLSRHLQGGSNSS